MSDWQKGVPGATVSRVVAGHFWADNVSVPVVERTPAMLDLARRQHALVVRRLGLDLYGEIVADFEANGRIRQEACRDLRGWWWTIRNHRACGQERIDDAVFNIMVLDCAMQDAGVSLDAWLRINACMSSGCVCDRCDLWDGQRIAVPSDGGAGGSVHQNGATRTL